MKFCRLGVPVKTFTAWRSKFRFGPMQIQADGAVIKRKEAIKKYMENRNVGARS